MYLLALPAITCNLKPVPQGPELVLLTHSLLQALYRTITELNHSPTSQAEKMVMMLMPQDMFIVAMPLSEENLP